MTRYNEPEPARIDIIAEDGTSFGHLLEMDVPKGYTTERADFWRSIYDPEAEVLVREVFGGDVKPIRPDDPRFRVAYAGAEMERGQSAWTDEVGWEWRGKIAYRFSPPEFFSRWSVVRDRTSPSGKTLFRCERCQRTSTTPDRYCPGEEEGVYSCSDELHNPPVAPLDVEPPTPAEQVGAASVAQFGEYARQVASEFHERFSQPYVSDSGTIMSRPKFLDVLLDTAKESAQKSGAKVFDMSLSGPTRLGPMIRDVEPKPVEPDPMVSFFLRHAFGAESYRVQKNPDGSFTHSFDFYDPEGQSSGPRIDEDEAMNMIGGTDADEDDRGWS